MNMALVPTILNIGVPHCPKRKRDRGDSDSDVTGGGEENWEGTNDLSLSKFYTVSSNENLASKIFEFSF